MTDQDEPVTVTFPKSQWEALLVGLAASANKDPSFISRRCHGHDVAQLWAKLKRLVRR